jgi:hypothetical protein
MRHEADAREVSAMANEEHLAILKQGVQDWNRWRKVNPDTQFISICRWL